jgi:hypothetical protein
VRRKFTVTEGKELGGNADLDDGVEVLAEFERAARVVHDRHGRVIVIRNELRDFRDC